MLLLTLDLFLPFMILSRSLTYFITPFLNYFPEDESWFRYVILYGINIFIYVELDRGETGISGFVIVSLVSENFRFFVLFSFEMYVGWSWEASRPGADLAKLDTMIRRHFLEDTVYHMASKNSSNFADTRVSWPSLFTVWEDFYFVGRELWTTWVAFLLLHNFTSLGWKYYIFSSFLFLKWHEYWNSRNKIL